MRGGPTTWETANFGFFFFKGYGAHRVLPSSPTRRSSDLEVAVRRSQSLAPPPREDPADAEALSHKLMLRAGLVRQLAAGVYVYLPLGQRVLDKVNAIIREEMNAIGGQEITMPVIHPADIWKQSGRWEGISEMF